MRSPLAFLCFDVEHDEEARATFVAQVAGSTAVAVDHWSTRPESPRADWDKLIQTNISRCDIMIILVGGSTKSAEGVLREIGYAKRSNVPFFGIYAEGTEAGAGLPEGLSANRATSWDWKQIDSAVKQLMAEGKHYSISNHT